MQLFETIYFHINPSTFHQIIFVLSFYALKNSSDVEKKKVPVANFYTFHYEIVIKIQGIMDIAK